MAKKTFETSREIEFFAINQLVLSEINPRQDVNDDEVKDLAESINTCGLIQNLSGIKLQDGKIGIVAGGRRLRALQVLSKKKGFNAFPIPVKIATNETEAQAWANAENIARQDLHPADEIRAYGRMSETGSPVSTIARAFAVTEAHVYKRLKLAELPSSILDALKAGKINLSIAEIFTRSTDAKRTEDALSAIERNEIKSEHQLKNYLNPQAVSITDKRAIYVGVDDYRAAGGATVTDLFSTEVLFEDSELLAKLYNDKLLAAAAEIQAEGWAWVECYYKPHIWYPIQEEKLEKLKPVGNQFSEEETKEFAQLKAKEIEEGLDDEENARLDYYEDQEVDIFSEQQKSVSGGYVYLNELGELQTSLGLVKRSHVPEAVKLGFLKEKPKDTSKAKPKGEYSQALKDDLRRARLGSLQKALLEKPELVLDLLAFSLCEKSSGSGYSPLDIKIGRPENKPNTETGFEFDTRLTHPADPYSWGNGDFITVEDKVSAFSEFQSKGQKHRDTVITEGLARTFWDYGKELTGKVECLSGANLRSVWTPTSENFFKRVSADDLDQIYRDVMGQGASKDFFSMKKKGKVEALDTLFNDPEVIQALSDDQREKIATWEPKK